MACHVEFVAWHVVSCRIESRQTDKQMVGTNVMYYDECFVVIELIGSSKEYEHYL